MARTDTLGNFLTDVADAIRTKAGTSGTIQASAFDTAIANIPSGGGTTIVEEKDVNFYDYDGTLVDSYTKSEFADLSALPDNPEHEGLTAQGWNWNLTDAKSWVATYGWLDIGQMYITDDGATRFYINVSDPKRTSMYMRLAVYGTTYIDWGDNTTPDTVTGSSVYYPEQYIYHEYNTAGKYVVSLSCPSTGDNKYVINNGAIFNKSNSVNTSDYYYRSLIYKIEIGEKLKTDSQQYQPLFNTLYGLETITMPKTVVRTPEMGTCYSLKFIVFPQPDSGYVTINSCTDNPQLKKVCLPLNVNFIGQFSNCTALESFTYTYNTAPTSAVLSGCRALKKATIHNNCKNFPLNLFLNCYNLRETNIPTSLTTINQYALRYCYNLVKLVFPKAVTTIQANSFQQCFALYLLDFTEHEAVPTLSNSNAFGSMTDYYIVVPDTLLTTWKSTSGWSSVATHIIDKTTWDNM